MFYDTRSWIAHTLAYLFVYLQDIILELGLKVIETNFFSHTRFSILIAIY